MEVFLTISTEWTEFLKYDKDLLVNYMYHIFDNAGITL